MKKTLPLLISLLLLGMIFSPASSTTHPPQPGEAEIAAFLSGHPLIADSDAEVLEVTLQRGVLVINLTQAFLPGGAYDPIPFNQLQHDLELAFNIHQYFMLTFLVEGLPLEAWGHPLPDFTEGGEPPMLLELPGDGPLAGVKIALSPGHGIYWNETWSAWFYQRAVWYGIREDLVNAEIMRYVQAALLNQGATVIQLRQLDFNAGTGVSGFPAWHEATRQYAIAQGLPDYIYNGGSNNFNSDIRARPYMANYYGADILISLHNNGWNGTYSGTETYFDTQNHPGSFALGSAVHNRIIHAIRTQYDPAWVDRGLKATTNTYGEIRLAQMPAVLVELAFMDRQFPDNAYLQDEAFKVLAANAITRGICDFWGVTCENVPITLSQVLETPQLSPAFGSGMCDSGWYRFANPRGHYAYLGLNANHSAQSSNQATWQPTLPVSGEYRVEAFIPRHGSIAWSCPDKTIHHDTGQAQYQILHANGLSDKIISQAHAANDWVDLGIFHFHHQMPAGVTLTDVTGEAAQTTTVSASAMRFTLVGNAGKQFYNTAWLGPDWITDEASPPEDSIRNFFIFHRSCLSEPIADADGVQIELAALLHQAATGYQVNPKALLAMMQAEQQALSQCPDAHALANLMGLSPATTARDQINTAAAALRQAVNHLSQNGTTPRNWAAGTPKVTLDGVSVIPANDSMAILFDYTQYAGVTWGGNMPDKNGVHAVYLAIRDFNLKAPLPRDLVHYYYPLFLR